ncbi:MAG: hypothetical protein QXM06_04135 [Archaeoglobaceae archaeon]
MEVFYPEKVEHPIFPKPEYWFRWEQRYIYEDLSSREKIYLDGYGKIHPAFGIYEAQVFLKDDEVIFKLYQRTESYDTGWKHDREGWSWLMKGMNSIILDGEVISFDYPLVLGKRWKSESKIGSVNFEVNGVVAAYISEDGKPSVAEGVDYKIPVKPPKPLAETGKWNFDDLELFCNKKAYTEWRDVVIPAGPREGENVTGYYVVLVETKFSKKRTVTEIWKDVRGAVPVIVYHRSDGKRILLAKKWSGLNF